MSFMRQPVVPVHAGIEAIPQEGLASSNFLHRVATFLKKIVGKPKHLNKIKNEKKLKEENKNPFLGQATFVVFRGSFKRVPFPKKEGKKKREDRKNRNSTQGIQKRNTSSNQL